jgi:hypothetical protein
MGLPSNAASAFFVVTVKWLARFAAGGCYACLQLAEHLSCYVAHLYVAVAGSSSDLRRSLTPALQIFSTSLEAD